MIAYVPIISDHGISRAKPIDGAAAAAPTPSGTPQFQMSTCQSGCWPGGGGMKYSAATSCAVAAYLQASSNASKVAACGLFFVTL